MKCVADDDTIAAPITGAGPAAVSVIRVSGPQTRQVLRALTDRGEDPVASARKVVLCRLKACRAGDGERELDQALITFFPGPRSYTGEDSAEISVHGSPYIVRELLAALQRQGVRPARPGEFTQRAFLHGKMDLSQAEAVADLVAAETEYQERAAREQFEGRLSGTVDKIGKPLRELLAEVEAAIDFSEEELDLQPTAAWLDVLQCAQKQVARYAASYERGRLFREGAKIVLTGLPNTGKSSLLNALLGEERMIVADIPGTTRDTVSEGVSLNGIYVVFQDTAGLAGAEAELDVLERQGVERAWNLLGQAGAAAFVFSPDLPFQPQLACYHRVAKVCPRILPVCNKEDLCRANGREETSELLTAGAGKPVLFVSALERTGLDEFRAELLHTLGLGNKENAWDVVVTNERHMQALADAGEALVRAAALIGQKEPLELTSFELKSALHSLDEIIGETVTEELLELIFSRFCVGK